MNRKSFFTIFLFAIYLNFSAINNSYSMLAVSLNGGDFNPITIDITKFANGNDKGSLAQQVIGNDLVSSGLFKCEPNASYKLLGKISSSAGDISIVYSLFDTQKRKCITKHKLVTKDNSLRYALHKIADVIYSSLTGEKPYFTSKIIFVAESGDPTYKTKRIAIMDQDGGNVHYLTQGKELVITPKISPDGKSLLYTGYVNDTPFTYLQDIASGRRTIIGLFKNGTIAPSFSSNGDKAIVSVLRENGNSNLFELDIKETIKALRSGNSYIEVKQNFRRLTYGDCIDSASYSSPDGKHIVFSSDRSGRQKLYVIDSDGSGVHLISHNEGSYSTPVWSPRGDYIAFTKKNRKGFSIGIMHPDGSGERILTTSFHSEKPCWSPNGRFIVFFKEFLPGQNKLYVVNVYSKAIREIKTPRCASDPDWQGNDNQ